MVRPPAPHIAPTQHELAKTSAGDYIAPSLCPPGFLNAVRAGIAQYSDDPLGITATQNLSYRDAVLRILGSSQRLVSYVRHWHLAKDERKLLPHEHSLLELFRKFARYAEGEAPGYVPIGAQARQDAVDEAVDAIWAVCNDMTVDEQTILPDTPPPAEVPLNGGPYWNSDRSRSASHDAHEWLLWFINAMHEQLRRFNIADYVPYTAFDILTRTKTLQHWACTQCTFAVRLREDDGGSDTASIEVSLSRNQAFQASKSPASLEGLIRNSFISQGRHQCPRCKWWLDKSGYTTLRSTPEILFVKLNRTTPSTHKSV